MTVYEQALAEHGRLKGKLSITLKDSLDTPEKLSIYYSPGVAEVSRAIAADNTPGRDAEFKGLVSR